MIQRVHESTLFLALMCLAACTTYDPLFCDKEQTCRDPDRPFCDLEGEYPASEGVARTCIPSPFDAGNEPDGGGGGGSAVDAGQGGEPDGSASDAATPCKWSPLLRLANVNSPSVLDLVGSLSPDGRTLYFSRTGDPGRSFFATRDSVGQAFGPPTQLPELGDDQFDLEISATGLEILYRASATIETATRGAPGGTFGDAEPTGLEGASPSLSGDGLALYFTAELQVLRATRRAIGEPWEAPVSVLPSSGFVGVDVSQDELRLLLTVNPFEEPAMPYAIAERATTDEEFGAPMPLPDGILAPDGVSYGVARWDASQTQVVATVAVSGQNAGDMHTSACQ